jgi:hypothetical protein
MYILAATENAFEQRARRFEMQLETKGFRYTEGEKRPPLRMSWNIKP